CWLYWLRHSPEGRRANLRPRKLTRLPRPLLQSSSSSRSSAIPGQVQSHSTKSARSWRECEPPFPLNSSSCSGTTCTEEKAKRISKISLRNHTNPFLRQESNSTHPLAIMICQTAKLRISHSTWAANVTTP